MIRWFSENPRRLPAVWGIAAGALASVAELLRIEGPGGVHLSFAPAILMMAELTGGWVAAAIAAAIVLLTGPLWKGEITAMLAIAVIATLCGRAIRGGITPLVLVPALAVAFLTQDILATGLKGTLLSRDPALALFYATFNLAVALAFTVLRPRRASGMVPLPRWRLEHVYFVLAATCLVPAATVVWHSETRAGSSLTAFVVASTLLGLLAAASAGGGSNWVALRVVQLIRDRSSAGRHASGRSRWLPREISRLLLRTRRVTDGLHRLTARQKLQLESTRRRSARAQEALQGCERSLREKQLALSAARARIVEVDARWRSFLDTVPDVLIVADSSGRIEFANAAVHPLLAWMPEKLVGTPLRDLVPSLHREKPSESDDDFPVAEPQDSSAREVETRVRDSRGGFRELSARTQTFSVRGESHLGIRLRDVSGLRFLVQELQEARKAAGTTQRTRDQFVATMSHEIRTPLHGLMATLDMLRSEAFTAEGRHRLAIARTSAKALLNIANDILDLSRINVGGMTLDRKPISLEKLIAEAVDETRARAEAAHLTVQTRTTGKLPSSVIGDPVRIKQVLRNLLSNALKFTSRGGVTVQAAYAGIECSIDVADTGEGVPEDRRASIFEPFVQGDSASSRRFGGAGLGLAISRKLSEAMGGSLTLLQTGRSGSTFRLTLPLPASTEAPIEEQSQRVLRPIQGNILVIEDDEASRYVAQTLLESLQCPARIASSGPEGLEIIRSGEFDLVLMDCEMPEMDGFETTSRIRQMLDQHIPIVAMTASTTAADRQRCFDAGMDDVLPKPFSKSALSEMLGKWLSDGAQSGPEAPLAERIASLAALDSVVFDELRESLRWQLPPLRKIYESFHAGARETIDLLGATDSSLDRETATRRLHSLQGSAGLVGARQIEHLAAWLPQALPEEKRQELSDALPLLRECLRRFERELEGRLRAVSER